jgi:microcystin-dependent protein
MILPFAGGAQALRAPRAHGQLLPIGSNFHMLFALYGTSFGGNGRNNFALPKLDGRIAIGGSPVGRTGERTLALTWLVASNGANHPLAGMVVAFGGSFVPDGWLAADGGTLSVSAHPALFAAIGAVFGGNGSTDFALPDLKGVAPMGIGTGPGLPPAELGRKVSGTVPGLGLNYLIAVAGHYPSLSDREQFPPHDPFLGQVVAFAGKKATEGWALCDGALLPIRDNMALYSLIGNSHGGDGEKDFALPDLRGRMLAGLAN